MGWRTAWCKMLLFHAKNFVRESHNFELAHLKRRFCTRLGFFWPSDWLEISEESHVCIVRRGRRRRGGGGVDFAHLAYENYSWINAR